MKIPKFGTKIALFDFFWSRILKNYCQIWNQHPRICQTVKFCEKIKMPKFGTKSTLFGHFGARIWKNCCHIWNQHPRICQICKISWKNENAYILDQKCLIWVFFFWAALWKQYCHIWNQLPRISLIGKFCEIMELPKFSNSYRDFWYRVHFF